MSLREWAVPSGLDMNGARMIAPGGFGNSTGAVQQNGDGTTNGLTFNQMPCRVRPGQASRGADDA